MRGNNAFLPLIRLSVKRKFRTDGGGRTRRNAHSALHALIHDTQLWWPRPRGARPRKWWVLTTRWPTAARLRGDWPIWKYFPGDLSINQSPCWLAAVGHQVASTYHFRGLAFLCLILASLASTKDRARLPIFTVGEVRTLSCGSRGQWREIPRN